MGWKSKLKHKVEHAAHHVARETEHAAHDVGHVATHATSHAEREIEKLPATVGEFEDAVEKLVLRRLPAAMEQVAREISGALVSDALGRVQHVARLISPDGLDIQISALTLSWSMLHDDAVDDALTAVRQHMAHGDWERALHDVCDIADPGELTITGQVSLLFGEDLGAGATLHISEPGHRIGEIVDAIKEIA